KNGNANGRSTLLPSSAPSPRGVPGGSTGRDRGAMSKPPAPFGERRTADASRSKRLRRTTRSPRSSRTATSSTSRSASPDAAAARGAALWSYACRARSSAEPRSTVPHALGAWAEARGPPASAPSATSRTPGTRRPRVRISRILSALLTLSGPRARFAATPYLRRRVSGRTAAAEETAAMAKKEKFGKLVLLERIDQTGLGEEFRAAKLGPAGLEKIVSILKLQPLVSG